ncbi:hypothetical protein C8R43DRAFT_1102565 [Mycena crocata]|nr:hypothetical protein C8R43DRAFT_1102565 [Mycena crocata]
MLILGMLSCALERGAPAVSTAYRILIPRGDPVRAKRRVSVLSCRPQTLLEDPNLSSLITTGDAPHLSPIPMEAAALKLATDVAVPAGTYLYDNLKNQTGRTKFEKGRTNLQSGWTVLQDDKAGGLIPPRNRLELLQTHAELVANREDVDEITNTVFGSLAHRQTAKEFKSKAKQFRKDVEIPAERAQMDNQFRRVQLELAAERRAPAAQSDLQACQGVAHAKSTANLARPPTVMDYPPPIPPKPIQSQRTWSAPVPLISSAPINSAGGPNRPLHQSRSRDALVATPPERPSLITNSKSLPPNTQHDTELPPAANTAQHACARRLQSGIPPIPIRQTIYPPISSRPEQIQHGTPAASGSKINDYELTRRLDQSHLDVAHQDPVGSSLVQVESGVRNKHAGRTPQNSSSRASNQPVHSTPAIRSRNDCSHAVVRNQTPVFGNGGQHSMSEPCFQPPIPQPITQSRDAATPPMHWNINPGPSREPTDGNPLGECLCFQNRHSPAVQYCNCRSRQLMSSSNMPTQQLPFLHAHPTSSPRRDHFASQNPSQNPSSRENNWGKHPCHAGARVPVLQVQLNFQYPADYSGAGYN